MTTTTERFTFVEFAYKGQPTWPTETDALVSIGSPDYDTMAEEDSFPGGIWFHFRDEEEFKSAFEENDAFDFIIIREQD